MQSAGETRARAEMLDARCTHEDPQGAEQTEGDLGLAVVAITGEEADELSREDEWTWRRLGEA